MKPNLITRNGRYSRSAITTYAHELARNFIAAYGHLEHRQHRTYADARAHYLAHAWVEARHDRTRWMVTPKRPEGPPIPKDGIILWREICTEDSAEEIPILVMFEIDGPSGDGWNEPRCGRNVMLYPPDGTELTWQEQDQLTDQVLEMVDERAFDRFYGN